MKRMLCLLMCFLIFIPVTGCQHPDDNGTYAFYYPRSDYGYNPQEGKFYNEIIGKEIREDISPANVHEVISMYLNGPMMQEFANPYPDNISLESVVIDEQTLYVTVSDHLSELTGIRLIIACACLGKTGMELTNTTSIQISCKKALLDGKKTITLQDDLIIVNDAAPDVAPEQE